MLLSRLLAYFENFLKCRFIVIGKSAINLYSFFRVRSQNNLLTFGDIENLL